MNTTNQTAVRYDFGDSKTESFKVLLDEGAYFFTPFHFHRECQLTLILEGNGTRFIGDSVARFGAGDLVLIGSGLPHVFRNDPHYYQPNAGLQAKAISIFFIPEFLGEEFWSHPENRFLSAWLQTSNRGVVFHGETRRRAAEEMKRIEGMKPGFPRLLALLDLLYRLFRSEEHQYLSEDSSGKPTFRLSDSHKLHKVFEYVMNHFREEVRLDEVASLASMSTPAFSRYFRRQTRKTFTEFLLDIRMAEASKLLLETDASIGEIAFRCGFQNLSNFNRRFKAVKKSTPRDFRSAFGE